MYRPLLDCGKVAGKMPALRGLPPCLHPSAGIGFFLAACSRLAGLEGSCSAPTFWQSTI
jgi:hypothetical protein